MRARSGLVIGLPLSGLLLASLLLVGLLVLAAVAFGADPTAAPAGLLESGDLRSEGTGPGLVGNPVLILAGVVALGLVTVLVTVLVVKLAQRD